LHKLGGDVYIRQELNKGFPMRNKSACDDDGQNPPESSGKSLVWFLVLILVVATAQALAVAVSR
jgi:hypothetical protein